MRICSRKTTKGAERRRGDVIGEGVEKRFRSFTTFSVFVRSKGKGILMRPVSLLPVLVRRPSGRAPETQHEPRTFISNASDTRASFSTCTSTEMCAHLAHVRLVSASWRTGRGHENCFGAGFLGDKGVTSLSEMAALSVERVSLSAEQIDCAYVKIHVRNNLKYTR